MYSTLKCTIKALINNPTKLGTAKFQIQFIEWLGLDKHI